MNHRRTLRISTPTKKSDEEQDNKRSQSIDSESKKLKNLAKNFEISHHMSDCLRAHYITI